MGVVASTTALLLALVVVVAQRPSFRSGVDLVEVDAIALNATGEVVTGLTRDDFEIREDGARVPIATFVPVSADGATQPSEARFVVVVLDNFVSSPANTVTIKHIAQRFVERKGLHDVMAVMQLSGGNARTTTNSAELLREIELFTPFGSSILKQLEQRALTLVADLIRQLSSVRHRRKTLVLVASSRMMRPTEEAGRGVLFFSQEWFDVIGAAARGNVAIYVIDPVGLTGSGSPYDGTISFAEATGGEAFINTNMFERSVDQIWSEAGNYYLLGYDAPNSKRTVHVIDVRVTRPGVRVRARHTRGS